MNQNLNYKNIRNKPKRIHKIRIFSYLIIISFAGLKSKDPQLLFFLQGPKSCPPQSGFPAKFADCLTKLPARCSISAIRMFGNLTCQPWAKSSFQRQLPLCVCSRPTIPNRINLCQSGSSLCIGWCFRPRPSSSSRFRTFLVPSNSSRPVGNTGFVRI